MFDFFKNKKDLDCGIDWINVTPLDLSNYYVHQIDEKGKTPLDYAALYCREIWVFERLIELGIDIHERHVPDVLAHDIELVKLFFNHNAKFSASMFAELGSFERFKSFEDIGVMANLTPQELDELFLSYVIDNKFLHGGALSEKLDDVEFYAIADSLINMGAKLNNPSPLVFLEHAGFISGEHKGELRDKETMISRLLKWGASVDKPKHEYIPKLLRWNSSVDTMHEKFIPPFNLAVQYCGVDVVSKYLEHGANVNDNFALLSAISTGNTPVVKLLLEAGANPNERLNSEIYILYALQEDYLGGLTASIEIPFDELDSITPLHLACCCIDYNQLHEIDAQPKIVQLLINHGADVNILTNKPKYTPLDFVIEYAKIFDEPEEIPEINKNDDRLAETRRTIAIEGNNAYEIYNKMAKLLKDAGAKSSEKPTS